MTNEEKFEQWSKKVEEHGYEKRGKNIPLKKDQVRTMLLNGNYIDKSNNNRRVTEVDLERTNNCHFYIDPYLPHIINIFIQGSYSGPFAWLD